MKDWALEHPVMTFLLADALICTIGNVIRLLCSASKEVKHDEPAGDID